MKNLSEKGSGGNQKDVRKSLCLSKGKSDIVYNSESKIKTSLAGAIHTRSVLEKIIKKPL